MGFLAIIKSENPWTNTHFHNKTKRFLEEGFVSVFMNWVHFDLMLILNSLILMTEKYKSFRSFTPK